MPRAVACTIYHNPRCSKSRATLALLQEQGIEPTVIEYLKHPPVAAEIKVLLRQLGLKAEHPVLIERPIVVLGDSAVLGRPPEQVLTLLNKRSKREAK
jgi:arsenate reductase